MSTRGCHSTSIGLYETKVDSMSGSQEHAKIVVRGRGSNKGREHMTRKLPYRTVSPGGSWLCVTQLVKPSKKKKKEACWIVELFPCRASPGEVAVLKAAVALLCHKKGHRLEQFFMCVYVHIHFPFKVDFTSCRTKAWDAHAYS
jgi:hypothetical protein